MVFRDGAGRWVRVPMRLSAAPPSVVYSALALAVQLRRSGPAAAAAAAAAGLQLTAEEQQQEALEEGDLEAAAVAAAEGGAQQQQQPAAWPRPPLPPLLHGQPGGGIRLEWVLERLWVPAVAEAAVRQCGSPPSSPEDLRWMLLVAALTHLRPRSMAASELTALLRMLPDAAQRAVAAHQQRQQQPQAAVGAGLSLSPAAAAQQLELEEGAAAADAAATAEQTQQRLALLRRTVQDLREAAREQELVLERQQPAQPLPLQVYQLASVARDLGRQSAAPPSCRAAPASAPSSGPRRGSWQQRRLGWHSWRSSAGSAPWWSRPESGGSGRGGGCRQHVIFANLRLSSSFRKNLHRDFWNANRVSGKNLH